MKKSILISLATIVVILGLLCYYFYPEQQLKEGQVADKIAIYKGRHKLYLYHKEQLLASYKISISKKGLDKKSMDGDNLTPEGIFKGKKRTQSNYHKAIEVGEWGKCCNVLIHGLGPTYGIFRKFHSWIDYTDGCIALTNNEIDEVYAAIKDGVIIEIYP